MTYKHILTDGDGWLVLERVIPEELIDNFIKRMHELRPVRALSCDKQYAEKDEINNLKDIAIWWSQTVMDWPEFQSIKSIIDEKVNPLMDQPTFYASDVVTIESNSTLINPHVDTPHRFEKWNLDRRMLGVQCIVSLFDIDENYASTGVVSESQKRDFYIDMCYSGYYDKWFKRKKTQPVMPKGSLLVYNCRVLHSSMPNTNSKSRPALLVNYLEGSVVGDVKPLDNIWNSQG